MTRTSIFQENRFFKKVDFQEKRIFQENRIFLKIELFKKIDLYILYVLLYFIFDIFVLLQGYISLIIGVYSPHSYPHRGGIHINTVPSQGFFYVFYISLIIGVYISYNRGIFPSLLSPFGGAAATQRRLQQPKGGCSNPKT